MIDSSFDLIRNFTPASNIPYWTVLIIHEHSWTTLKREKIFKILILEPPKSPPSRLNAWDNDTLYSGGSNQNQNRDQMRGKMID